ncbi:hypothetical protein NL676_039106 [Syzygium grande]|nr:hypothetical protein NL676_039106 [Syzygium grande]
MTWRCTRPQSTQETQRIIGTGRRQYGSSPGLSSTQLAGSSRSMPGSSASCATRGSWPQPLDPQPISLVPVVHHGPRESHCDQAGAHQGVISAHNVLLLNSKDPAVVPFVEELKRRFLHYHESKRVKRHALKLPAPVWTTRYRVSTSEVHGHDSGDPDISPDDGLTPLRGLLNDEIETAKSSDSRGAATARHVHVAELEMLLEAYFVQVDGTLNKLSTLREYVDDTEDYVNIMLDDKQNNLLQMGVLITTAILVISGYIVLASVMGINIAITLWHSTIQSHEDFVWTNVACTVMTILLYVGIVAWYKYKGLVY